jgi:hypothetical protein
MSTSRRQFVQFAGFSIASLTASRLPSWLARGRVADLPALGLHLEIPAPWYFVSGALLEHARGEVVLPGGEPAKAEVMEMAGQPLLVAAREPYPVPGPTMVVWCQPADDDDHAADEAERFARIHDLSYRMYGGYMRDYAILAPGRAAARRTSYGWRATCCDGHTRG